MITEIICVGWEWGVGKKLFECTEFFQKSNMSPIADIIQNNFHVSMSIYNRVSGVQNLT
ncbi:hypothetical protein ANSO36C_17060 [Nostoc cf. commune SO-36]|uniref:Uncharacterized protein n=1 Tax=Nostoc cf. commune SO-36 TaxID=449208 RepID=A0ABN6Q258_NOSCO|nr:hypothetical protein ANSO36C_17060 [Nostoc cf. commune SO-36]